MAAALRKRASSSLDLSPAVDPNLASRPDRSAASESWTVDRRRYFANVLHPSEPFLLPFAQFRQLCFRTGIPDSPSSLRPLCYKLLFRSLPYDKSRWSVALGDKRTLYYDYMKDCVETEPTPTSEKILEQIDKDVRRTLPDLAFFQQWTPILVESPLSPCNVQERDLYRTARSLFLRLRDLDADFGTRRHENFIQQESDLPSAFDCGVDFHWEVIERILFVYSALNPGVSYVQGMNELLGPLYFLAANVSGSEQRAHAEADTFWMFFQLMTEVKDHYLHSMDRDRTAGIGASMQRLFQLLGKRDPELYENLVSKDLQPIYFALRWLSLLMAQEFPLPELFRLWDSLFADERRFEFLLHFACAMLMLVRTSLMEGSLNDNISLLQAYPLKEVGPILELAYRLYDEEMVDQYTAA